MNQPFQLHLGDCIEVMRTMADGSVDSIVTDPPYELGFMGKAWDSTGIANSVEMWREALRVLKPGGHLLAFSGTRTQHRMVCAIEDAGFEIRDQFGWAYGSGFPKSRNIAADMDGQDAAQWKGWGTAVKPAWEPICFARKPMAIGLTVAASVLAHGTGALNIDGCRVPGEPIAVMASTGGRKFEQAHTQPERRNIQVGMSDAGRWPANIIHDGSDDVIALFPDSNGSGAARALKRGARDGEGWGMSDEVGDLRDAGTGSAARFFYCAKASRADRNEGMGSSSTPAVATDATMREREDADWPARNGNHHPTVKPTDLMAYLCRLVTPPGGTVLDPFMGSGSTGKAAMREGFQFIGIDMTEEYIGIARARIAHECVKVAADNIAAAAEAERLSAQANLFEELP